MDVWPLYTSIHKSHTPTYRHTQRHIHTFTEHGHTSPQTHTQNTQRYRYKCTHTHWGAGGREGRTHMPSWQTAEKTAKLAISSFPGRKRIGGSKISAKWHFLISSI